VRHVVSGLADVRVFAGPPGAWKVHSGQTPRPRLDPAGALLDTDTLSGGLDRHAITSWSTSTARMTLCSEWIRIPIHALRNRRVG
jgi:hypothetical protein